MGHGSRGVRQDVVGDLGREALERARTTGERVWEAELVRLEGELRLAASPDDVAEAMECFRRAIEIARRQAARSWELRAASSLARRLVAAGRRDEARHALAGVYEWFTEGFDTADLGEAKALLDGLGATPGDRPRPSAPRTATGLPEAPAGGGRGPGGN